MGVQKINIHFLTTDISGGTGGADYDRNFFRVLQEVHSDVTLYNDEYFISRSTQGKRSLLNFNK